MLKTFLYLAAGLLLAWCSWFVPIYLVGLLLGDFLVAIHLFALFLSVSTAYGFHSFAVRRKQKGVGQFVFVVTVIACLCMGAVMLVVTSV
jgi:hypothetical protein